MRSSSLLAVAVGVVVVATSVVASAITQPDGTVIPQGPSLQALFDSRGEAIDALGDALTVPETFIPSCALTFTVLQRNAGYQNSFGWYNVTGQKPTDAELHEFLTCTDAVGTEKVLAIKNDPAYLGGEIGFYEATGSCATTTDYVAVFFSQKQYNPDGSQQNPYTHLLTYNSTVVPKAFYFGWEDLLSGGDNDFDDLTTFVTGISCSGGGGECQTGQPGVCGAGTMQCQGGALACVQSVQPSAEACDGVDNDCNDLVDDGELCPVGEVCDQGNCVPACGSGEFICPQGRVCNSSGYCVDPLCLEVSCGTGTKCVAGECVGPCDGVSCPQGLTCVVGVCLDPCVGIRCDREQVCVAGACVDPCSCAGCDDAQTCQANGICTFTVCEGVVCDPGTYCDATGTCVDACEGAVCPGGGVCVDGQCQENTGTGAGTGGGGGSGSTGEFVGAGGSTGTGTAANGTGGSGASDATSAGGAGPGSGEESGCGCRTVGGSRSASWALAGALAFLALATAARRRRSSP